MYPRALTHVMRGIVAASVLAGVACGGSVELPGTDSDLDGLSPIQCDVDSSNQVSQAWPASIGEAVGNTICPRTDRDYWRVTGVGGDRQLLNVDITYSKLSAIELRTEVYGPRGRCMDNAITPCAADGTCSPPNSYCDRDRGGCRLPDAPICFRNTDCAGQQCYGATSVTELLGDTRIPASSALLHRLSANFPAFQTGDYTIGIFDHAEREQDPEVQYALTVTQQTDPDNNEPNNLVNQATPIGNDEELDGAMSYIGDVDYYIVTPTVAGQAAVVEVDLSYSATAAIAPTWSLRQGTFEYLGPDAKTEGSGATAIRRQKTAVVTRNSDPVIIRVENAAQATNTTDIYSIHVRFGTDPSEGANRNDTIATATAVNAGGPSAAPSSGMPSSFYSNNTRTLVAANDIDWYKVDKTGGNSLLHGFLTSTAASAPYALVFQVYRESEAVCSDTSPCSQGRPCSQAGLCLDLLVQRPSPDGPGDPQLGGLVPNYIETQQPFFNGPYYIRVVHDAATRQDVDGYDFEGANPYQLRLAHVTEPDGEDASATPDNKFVARPLRAQLSDFVDHYRTSFGKSVTPGSGTFRMGVVPSSVIGASGCTQQTVTLYETTGVPLGAMATSSVAITATNASLREGGCSGAALASPRATTGGSFNIGVTPAAAGDVTLAIAVDGGASVQSLLSTTAGEGIRFIPRPTNASRSLPANGWSVPIAVSLPSPAGATTDVVLRASSGGVSCLDVSASDATRCLNDDGGADYCTVAPRAQCRIRYNAGGQNYNVRTYFTAANAPGYLYVNRGGDDVERYQWSVYTAGVAASSAYSITGWISYEGDQDFFELAPANSGLRGGGMTIFVDYPSSQVDIRASLFRGNRASSVGYGGSETIQESCETCGGNSLPGWTCYTPRQTCQQADFSDPNVMSAGPEATDAQCAYSGDATSPIRVWVNEKSSNDWDARASAQYAIRVIYREGCPQECSQDLCN